MSLFFRATAALASLAFGFTAIVPFVVPPHEPVAPEVSVPASHTRPDIQPLPSTNQKAASSLLERSPFARDRTTFARNAGPPLPQVDVRLAGIFRVGTELRASLVVGGQNTVVRVGDLTAAGSVTAIESSAVVLDGSRRIDLFRQPGSVQ